MMTTVGAYLLITLTQLTGGAIQPAWKDMPSRTDCENHGKTLELAYQNQGWGTANYLCVPLIVTPAGPPR